MPARPINSLTRLRRNDKGGIWFDQVWHSRRLFLFVWREVDLSGPVDVHVKSLFMYVYDRNGSYENEKYVPSCTASQSVVGENVTFKPLQVNCPVPLRAETFQL